MAESSPILSIDYTDLFRHRSRSYTFDTVAIKPGIDWLGFGWGIGLGGAVTIVTALLLTMIEVPWLPWWLGLIAALATTGATSAIVTREAGNTRSATAAAAVGLALGVIELSWLPWWVGLVLGLVVVVVVYRLTSKDSRGSVSPIEQLFLAVDYTFRQPTRIQGGGSDDAPTDLHWQAVLFRPEWMPPTIDSFAPPAQYGVPERT